jgi:peroxiredoxin
MSKNRAIPSWMILVVRIAAVYHFFLGLFMALFPKVIFVWLGIHPPDYLFIWQSLGTLVALYGLAYYLASYNIVKHYPIILVGLLSNTFVTVAFVFAYFSDQIHANFFWLVFINDVVWLGPFTFIWAYIFKEFQNTSLNINLQKEEALTNFFVHDTGESIFEMSEKQPVLMIFLRHFGCSFCRELLNELSESRMDLWKSNYRLVIVHMSSDDEAHDFLKPYDLDGISQISDPTCTLYESFGVKRASYLQTFHFKSWWKAFLLMCHGVFIGKLSGDGFRKAATAIIYQGEVIKFSLPEYVFEQPDMA